MQVSKKEIFCGALIDAQQVVILNVLIVISAHVIADLQSLASYYGLLTSGKIFEPNHSQGQVILLLIISTIPEDLLIGVIQIVDMSLVLQGIREREDARESVTSDLILGVTGVLRYVSMVKIERENEETSFM